MTADRVEHLLDSENRRLRNDLADSEGRCVELELRLIRMEEAYDGQRDKCVLAERLLEKLRVRLDAAERLGRLYRFRKMFVASLARGTSQATNPGKALEDNREAMNKAVDAWWALVEEAVTE